MSLKSFIILFSHLDKIGWLEIIVANALSVFLPKYGIVFFSNLIIPSFEPLSIAYKYKLEI